MQEPPPEPASRHLALSPGLPTQAGGRGSDGKRRVLSIVPEKLHQRLPLFLGSARDIAELESYGDVQQGAKTYEL
jgi:hypothetical protein